MVRNRHRNRATTPNLTHEMRYTTGQHDMSNDKLAEALREVLTDINLVKCHWCKCHTWCSVEDACKTLAEHEAHAAEAAQAQAKAPVSMPDVDTMVTRFLSWRLPKSFAPDAGISFKPMPDIYMPHCWPIGTNLFDAGQAKEMILHMLGDDCAAATQPQAAEPVAVIESAEDRHGPYLTHANVVLRVWNGYVPKAGDEIYTHPQPAQGAKCPHVITSGEGTSHCRLAEQDTKDAARYRWLRDSADSYTWDYLGGIGAGRVDAAIDAAMAKESGR